MSIIFVRTTKDGCAVARRFLFGRMVGTEAGAQVRALASKPVINDCFLLCTEGPIFC